MGMAFPASQSIKGLMSFIFGLGDEHQQPAIRSISMPPFGTSKRSVAGERRKAKKRRAVKRARRLGHG